ncbi:MAG: hypothetical protein WD049_06180 [Candidatus Paceibacterota bacterium]
MNSRLHSRRLLKRIVYSKGAVFVLVVLTAFALKASWGAYQKMSESGQRAAVVREETHELAQEKDVLLEELARLETRRGIEEELRRKYSVTKEGEELVVIVDSEVEAYVEEESESSVLGEIWNAVVNFFR